MIREDNDRHQLYLQKLASGIINSKLYPSIDAAVKAARMILLDAEEITSIKQLQNIQSAVTAAAREHMGEGWALATSELQSLAVYEAKYFADLMSKNTGKYFSVPADKAIQGYIKKSAMTLTNGSRVSSGTWAEYVNGATESAARLYNGIVVSGYQNGLTVNQIAKQIKDASAGTLTNEATTLARTGMGHYANGAREAMAADNDDIIKYRVYSATYDNRTSLQCRKHSIDPGYWDIKDPKYPPIPNHHGCRCSWLFVSELEDITRGKQVAIGGNDVEVDPDRKLTYRGKKDADIFNPGQIDAGMSQNEWMKQQPAWFQDSALGPERAKLFRDGGIKIENFTDSLGKPITLDKLRELDAEAFRRAKL